MFVFQMPAEFSKIHERNRLCCTAIVLTLHRRNILIIFKQLSVLPFLQEDFTACFAIFSISKKWRAQVFLFV